MNPIVIGGSPRSGTTLLLSFLSGHPDLAAIPFETYALSPTLDLQRLRDQIGDLWNERWVEKTPLNVRNIGPILESLPGASFIHVVRDGRDVVTSRFPGQDHYAMPPAEWVEDVSRGLAFFDHPRVLTLRYEDFVAEGSTVWERLCAFLNLRISLRMIDYPRFATVTLAPAWTHPAKPFHEGAIGHWREPEHAEPVARFMDNPAAVELLENLGYRPGRELYFPFHGKEERDE